MTQRISSFSYFKNIYPHLSESRFLSEAKGSYLDELYENDELDEHGEIEEVSEINEQFNDDDELDYDEEKS